VSRTVETATSSDSTISGSGHRLFRRNRRGPSLRFCLSCMWSACPVVPAVWPSPYKHVLKQWVPRVDGIDRGEALAWLCWQEVFSKVDVSRHGLW